MSQNIKEADSPRKLIIIDDNPEIHKDFATILTNDSSVYQLEGLERELFGYKKTTPKWIGPRFELDFANQGREGVEKIKSAQERKNPYQLAFVDMRMPPGWDGLKTIEEIWKIDPALQVVLCTAYSDYSWEEINEGLGKTDNLLILKKPFDSTEVSQLAATLTQKWSLARKAEIKHNELEQLVAQRTQELREKNKQLKKEISRRKELKEQLIRSKKMEAIGTLAAGVAHDLNNILSGILTYPELLLLNMDEDDPMHRPLSIIKRSGHKAAAIVQDLLAFARRNVAIKNPVDLPLIVGNFINGPEYKVLKEYHKDIRIEHQLPSDIPPVRGSEVHLEKVVMNLISNAAESMERGGLIGIKLEQIRLENVLPGYTDVVPGNYVKMTVKDQGKGIAPDDLDHIFEPFFTKKKLGISGTGLGMTVVWDTVINHDGYIEVDSTINQGTTVSVYLPATEKIIANEEPTPGQGYRGQGERILVVDDIPEQREIASAIFKQLGYSVDAVSSGESALRYITKQPVDLLLLDMVMDPGIDGLETFQKALEINPNQKVVIASGYTKNDRVRFALQLGASFIHKPYHMEDIAQTVKNILNPQVLSN